MKKYLLSTAMAALLLYAGPVQATTVTAGDTVTVDWSDPVTLFGTSATLSGSLVLSNFNFSGANSVTFTMAVANDTLQGGLTNAQWQSIRLTSFGFNTDPDATTVSDTSAAFVVQLDSNQPLPSFGKLDVCTFPTSDNCAGGANDGLVPGGSATFNVTLSGFATDITSLDVGIGANESFAVKFQTGSGSFEFSNPPDCPDCAPNPQCAPGAPCDVPEPATIALLGTGLASLGGGLWWRRRKSVA